MKKTNKRYKTGDWIAILSKHPKPRSWAQSRNRLIEGSWTPREADKEIKEMQQYYKGTNNQA